KQLHLQFKFHTQQQTLPILTIHNHKPLTIKLNPILPKYQQQKQKIIHQISYYLHQPIPHMPHQHINNLHHIQI
ncbi:DUF1444 family protein, partial [Staphylococcus epidermidis]|uniref:DUF1444 family protein n=1 Tax=Staphylococcus epidermidis TaxID=1282 RepID=UPI0011AA665F